MMCVMHIENASHNQLSLKAGRRQQELIREVTNILRLFLVSSSSVFFCGLSYQERETWRALTSEVHSPFLACPTVRWPCGLDSPLSTACRGRLNMQDTQAAQGFHSMAVLELFTSQPHITTLFSCCKCWKSTCRLLDGNTATIIWQGSRDGYWFPPGCISKNKLALIHENWQDFYTMCLYAVCEVGCSNDKMFWNMGE